MGKTPGIFEISLGISPGISFKISPDISTRFSKNFSADFSLIHLGTPVKNYQGISSGVSLVTQRILLGIALRIPTKNLLEILLRI